ncbi:C-type mannose receptor 2-like [Melanotaenia boesemani]|uniref:C-type mannose receptor 2-like n=1 Tax=Melanotaenia boesemani TaxID=1250792 RepID=UPI001C048B37|nr:C-type mannose receptor 2-like [Melanotaenia boesemani]
MQLSLFLLNLVGQCCFTTCLLYEYRYINDKMTWSTAQQYCRKKYTDLATVANMTDMKRLYKSTMMQGGEAWIGLYKDVTWTWHWSLPGVEFNDNMTNWQQGEGNVTGTENCGFINKVFKWGDDPCVGKDHFFLCFNESNPSQKIYLIEENKAWWEAQRYCREKHTDLVGGVDQLQHEKLKRLVNSSDNNIFYIGLFKDSWRWSDGSSFSFRQWSVSITDPQSQTTDQCAVMVKDSERWNSHDCDEKKPFFCYDDKVILIRQQMNWENALYYCREHHRDLVTITNLDEQRWVQEKAKNASTPYVWTGLRYTCTLDFWFWVSNQAVTYKNWASGQDGNDCDMSGAMETGGEHKWFKINDNNKMNFICSKS